MIYSKTWKLLKGGQRAKLEMGAFYFYDVNSSGVQHPCESRTSKDSLVARYRATEEAMREEKVSPKSVLGRTWNIDRNGGEPSQAFCTSVKFCWAGI
jgi:hypothetical protein